MIKNIYFHELPFLIDFSSSKDHGRTWPGPAVASATPAQTHFFYKKIIM